MQKKKKEKKKPQLVKGNILTIYEHFIFQTNVGQIFTNGSSPRVTILNNVWTRA